MLLLAQSAAHVSQHAHQGLQSVGKELCLSLSRIAHVHQSQRIIQGLLPMSCFVVREIERK